VTSSPGRKGNSAELEIAKILAAELDVRVRRKLGAGRLDDEGDLEGLTSTTVEVKAYSDTLRAIREALADLEREQDNARTDFAVAFIKRPRSGWIAVSTVPQWCALWREATS
jgi:predicted phosphoribosyltransferase